MKKRILIVSDNHRIDNISYLKKMEQCQYAFHAGDSQFDYDSEQIQEFDLKVRGNTDYDVNYPEEICTYLEGIGNVFVTHGHLRGVKYSLFDLQDFCVSKEIKLCVYGHTHILNILYEKEADLLIINPGSTTYSRSKYKETYVILTYTVDKYIIEVKDIKTNKKIKKEEYFRI